MAVFWSRFDTIHERDRHPVTQTDIHRTTVRLCTSIASSGNKYRNVCMQLCRYRNSGMMLAYSASAICIIMLTLSIISPLLNCCQSAKDLLRLKRDMFCNLAQTVLSFQSNLFVFHHCFTCTLYCIVT